MCIRDRHAAVPQGYDGATYIEDVITRFQNGNLPYANLQVGTDSSQKIQQRWLPTIDLALKNKAGTSYFEFWLVAWVIVIQTAIGKEVLNDPKRDELKQAITNDLGQMITGFLTIANAKQYGFFCNEAFMASVKNYAKAIKTHGIKQALTVFLTDSQS